MPYTQVTEMLECVDDVDSEYYNQLVLREGVDSVDWQSSEKMIRIDPWYRWGVIVDHNRDPIENGAGCCIFLHNTTGAGDRTSGCTAIEPDYMREIVFWLDSQKRPILVQLTREDYGALHDSWDLPEIQ